MGKIYCILSDCLKKVLVHSHYATYGKRPIFKKKHGNQAMEKKCSRGAFIKGLLLDLPLKSGLSIPII
jgi:hypothetical protein